MSLAVPISVVAFCNRIKLEVREQAVVFDRMTDREYADDLPGLTRGRFIAACHAYEKDRGKRAPNDYRKGGKVYGHNDD